MPTVFREAGYRFFFYSNEHLPKHIHVESGEGGLSANEIRKMRKLVIENRRQLIKYWDEFFGVKSPNAIKVWFEEGRIYFLLEDGRELGVPLDWFPLLKAASESEINNWRFIGGGDGVHWPDLDEDISIESILVLK